MEQDAEKVKVFVMAEERYTALLRFVKAATAPYQVIAPIVATLETQGQIMSIPVGILQEINQDGQGDNGGSGKEDGGD